jgi:hypothetical protein
MSNQNSTIEKQIEKRLGISIATWDKIELASLGLLVIITARETMDVVGSKGVFGGRLKSKKLQRMSRLGFERSTWTDLNVFSSLMGAALLLKGAVDTVENKTDLLSRKNSLKLTRPIRGFSGNLQGFGRNRII